MSVLGLDATQIEAGGAHWTAREITQQPQLWREIAWLIANDAALANFIAPCRAHKDLRLVLTGAGTSSFIGECLAPALSRHGWFRPEAIATTDIVASPGSFLTRDAPTLMVHFARSGNSPESAAALELAEHGIERCHHLIVTCNGQGELYRRAAALRHAHTLLLPEASNDRSFAMTSSFTGMLLAAAAALQVQPVTEGRIERLAAIGTHVLGAALPLIGSLVQAGPERAVYLGNRELRGLAREAALKMLELTDGGVIAIAESPLGFRHGPKTILNDRTVVVAFLSNDPHTRRYELDLLQELRREAVAGRVVALGARADTAGAADADTLALGEGAAALTDLELCLPYAIFAQSLAMRRSLSLGLSPDTPNAAGTVNRVVQGVSIYPYGGGA
ncbi:MAG: SIS domain-containing protein [Gammaproteobacteria bacterium]|nr:SIS domain-containing protein [Gammaproteobacteria bacterium]